MRQTQAIRRGKTPEINYFETRANAFDERWQRGVNCDFISGESRKTFYFCGDSRDTSHEIAEIFLNNTFFLLFFSFCHHQSRKFGCAVIWRNCLPDETRVNEFSINFSRLAAFYRINFRQLCNSFPTEMRLDFLVQRSVNVFRLKVKNRKIINYASKKKERKPL